MKRYFQKNCSLYFKRQPPGIWESLQAKLIDGADLDSMSQADFFSVSNSPKGEPPCKKTTLLYWVLNGLIYMGSSSDILYYKKHQKRSFLCGVWCLTPQDATYVLPKQVWWPGSSLETLNFTTFSPTAFCSVWGYPVFNSTRHDCTPAGTSLNSLAILSPKHPLVP